MNSHTFLSRLTLFFKAFNLSMLIFFVAAGLNQNTVSALIPEQRNLYRSGINYFDTVVAANGQCGVNIPTNLAGNDNIEKAYNFFIGKGLKPFQAAGILGNLQQESNVNPNSEQKINPKSPDYPRRGLGIAQWSFNERWQNLLKFASQQNKDPKDLGLQLDFLWLEASPGGERGKTVAAMQATTSAEDAAITFEKVFENAGNPKMELRIKYANEILAKYGGTAPAGSGIPSSGGCAGNGVATKYIDGFTVYNQYDPAWKDLPYASSTIGISGCGPAAMAMIITNLTGKAVTPVEAANYAAAKNLYVNGVGSSWSIGPVLAEKYGLRATAVGANVAEITAVLQKGGLVIAPGSGADPFTSGGHFIVIRAVTAGGMWKVGDSGHSDTSDKDWSPQQLVSQMRPGGVYAITK